METRRIAELLEPFLAAPLQQVQLDQISTYIDLLLRWNARINLTAIRAPEQIVTRHFGESLFAARHLLAPQVGGTESPASSGETARPERSRRVLARPAVPQPTGAAPFAPSEGCHEGGPAAPPFASCVGSETSSSPSSPRSSGETGERVLDVGSGAGFPGIPLKIFHPAIQIALLESNQKKVAFMREVIRALTLTDIDVSPTRAEDFPSASAGLVTLRAVERFKDILPTAARLVAPNGRLALLIGVTQLPSAHHLASSFHWAKPIPTPQSRDRVLLIGRKVAQ